MITVVPLQTDFDANPILTLTGEMEYFANIGLIAVQILNKAAQTTFVLKYFIFARTLIGQSDSNAGVHELRHSNHFDR